MTERKRFKSAEEVVKEIERIIKENLKVSKEHLPTIVLANRIEAINGVSLTSLEDLLVTNSEIRIAEGYSVPLFITPMDEIIVVGFLYDQTYYYVSLLVDKGDESNGKQQ